MYATGQLLPILTVRFSARDFDFELQIAPTLAAVCSVGFDKRALLPLPMGP